MCIDAQAGVYTHFYSTVINNHPTEGWCDLQRARLIFVCPLFGCSHFTTAQAYDILRLLQINDSEWYAESNVREIGENWVEFISGYIFGVLLYEA